MRFSDFLPGKAVLFFCAVLTGISGLSGLAAASTGDPHYCNPDRCKKYDQATSFLAFDDWAAQSPRPAEMLNEWLVSGKGGVTSYDRLVDGHDDWAAAYLADTRALEHLELRLVDGRWIGALDLLTGIHRLEGDRIKMGLDLRVFNLWLAAGSPFRLRHEDGSAEQGRFHFDRGDHGGSLHHDSDLQGYTSIVHVPRIQFNISLVRKEADIDLDAFQPWIGGFIPNPEHLTYRNSDPRQWLDEYRRKYGDPGFRTRPYTRPGADSDAEGLEPAFGEKID